jgi:NAD(P)-dependent dehydrogenase (short-subunit alcohol dehydrogenase family)
MTFKDKVVIVTCSGDGIGRSVALNYARQGAKVVVAEKNEKTGRETVDRIYDESGNAIFFQVDVGDDDDVVHLMKSVYNCYHRIDILVNVLDDTQVRPIADQSLEDWNIIAHRNVSSVFLCSREVIKYMRPQKSGRIITITSSKTSTGEAHQEAYVAAKGDVIAMTHSMAMSLLDDKIKVNCICPGLMKTLGYERLSKVDHDQITFSSDFIDDIARTCLYITDEESDCINGSTIVIEQALIRKLVLLKN